MGLVAVMSADLLTNTSDTRLAVSRFITWASEPKSPEVRKVMMLDCDYSIVVEMLLNFFQQILT